MIKTPGDLFEEARARSLAAKLESSRTRLEIVLGTPIERLKSPVFVFEISSRLPSGVRTASDVGR